MLIARAHRALHPTLLGHAQRRHGVLGRQGLVPRIDAPEHFSALPAQPASRPAWPQLRAHAHLLAASMLGGAQRAMASSWAQGIVARLGTAGAEQLPYPTQIVAPGRRPLRGVDVGLRAPPQQRWQRSALAAHLGAAVGLALRLVLAALGALHGAGAHVWHHMRGRQILEGPAPSPLWLPEQAALDAAARATVAALIARALTPPEDTLPDATWRRSRKRAAQAALHAAHRAPSFLPNMGLHGNIRLERINLPALRTAMEEHRAHAKLQAAVEKRQQHQPPFAWLDDDDRQPPTNASVCVQVADDVAEWQRAMVRPLLTQRTLLRLLHPPVHPLAGTALSPQRKTTGRPGPWVLRDRLQPQYVQQAPAQATWCVAPGTSADALVLDGTLAWSRMPPLALANKTSRASSPEHAQLQPGLRLWARLELRATPTPCGAGGILHDVRARVAIDASDTVAMGPLGLPGAPPAAGP